MSDLSKDPVSMEIYKTIFATWRSQVDSYWQRSNYFAAFETAALVGCWSLMENKHTGIGSLCAVLGISLTIVWSFNNSIVHSYVLYWWESLKTVEKALSMPERGFAFVTNHPGSGGYVHYSSLTQIIPGLFMAAWIVLATDGITLVRGTTMSGVTDLATILAAVAGLWAIAMAWLTYAMVTRNDKKKLFESLKSLVSGVRSELDWIKPWASSDGDGYSRTTRPEDCPADWRNPGRIIYRFGYDTIRGLTSSPYASYLGDLTPFVRLSYSIVRLFQHCDECRAYALSRPDFYDNLAGDEAAGKRQQYLDLIFEKNYQIHMDCIGGKDTPDEGCLYKAYKSADAALDKLSTNLKLQALPWWFMCGHVIAILSFCAGGYLLYAILSK